MKFTKIVLAYFVIGSVMMAGGVITLQDSGVVSKMFVVGDDGDLDPTNEIEANFNSIGNTISTAGQVFGAGIILVWNLIVGLLTFSTWPYSTLSSLNAPPSLTLTVGGGITMAFYLSVVTVVRSSA